MKNQPRSPAKAADKAKDSAVEKPASDRAAAAAAPVAPTVEPGGSDVLREWVDALVFAFVVAMFIRVFVVELFKIPSGSMTPTLLGDYVLREDLDADGLDDLVVRGGGHTVLAFMNRGDHMECDEEMSRTIVADGRFGRWTREGKFREQYDRILVNKFAYWRKNPAIGDVVVFKVPPPQWTAGKPIYIKRTVGAPGDTIEFDGRLVANGEPVESPEFFKHQEYLNDRVSLGNLREFGQFDYVDYSIARTHVELTQVRVPDDSIYVLGDNTRSSLDSRYWGAVPLPNVKGRAFIRYWPWRQTKFIR